jgi:hypothetical protein
MHAQEDASNRNTLMQEYQNSDETGSCIFHLVAARKTRVVGWCKGEPLFSIIQVGSCVTGSWCFHPVGAGTLKELVLPSTGC